MKSGKGSEFSRVSGRQGGPLPRCSFLHWETKSSQVLWVSDHITCPGHVYIQLCLLPPAQPQWPLIMSPLLGSRLPRTLDKTNRAMDIPGNKLSLVDKGKIRKEGPRGRSGTKLVPKPLGVTKPQHSCDISSRHLRHNNNSSDQSSSVFRQL